MYKPYQVKAHRDVLRQLFTIEQLAGGFQRQWFAGEHHETGKQPTKSQQAAILNNALENLESVIMTGQALPNPTTGVVSQLSQPQKTNLSKTAGKGQPADARRTSHKVAGHGVPANKPSTQLGTSAAQVLDSIQELADSPAYTNLESVIPGVWTLEETLRRGIAFSNFLPAHLDELDQLLTVVQRNCRSFFYETDGRQLDAVLSYENRINQRVTEFRRLHGLAKMAVRHELKMQANVREYIAIPDALYRNMVDAVQNLFQASNILKKWIDDDQQYLIKIQHNIDQLRLEKQNLQRYQIHGVMETQHLENVKNRRQFQLDQLSQDFYDKAHTHRRLQRLSQRQSGGETKPDSRQKLKRTNRLLQEMDTLKSGYRKLKGSVSSMDDLSKRHNHSLALVKQRSAQIDDYVGQLEKIIRAKKQYTMSAPPPQMERVVIEKFYETENCNQVLQMLAEKMNYNRSDLEKLICKVTNASERRNSKQQITLGQIKYGLQKLNRPDLVDLIDRFLIKSSRNAKERLLQEIKTT